jgi:hypothetical protein
MDLKTRAQNMVTKPAVEWPVVAAESTTPAELITGYAAPLAAIPAICSFIGGTFIGYGVPGIGMVRTTSLIGGLFAAIISFVLGLVGLYVGAIVIEKLAPTFQSRGNTTQALKTVVYASTPVWLAGVFNLIPGLGGIIGLLAALYAIYLFFLGLPHTMHTPESQVVPYMLVSALVVIVINFCLIYIGMMITGVGMYRL